jgi:hypothetical protein
MKFSKRFLLGMAGFLICGLACGGNYTEPKSQAALLSLVGSFAWATDLNAPVANSPTVGSEIARGLDAAESCGDQNKDPIYISKCAFDTDSANRQQHSNVKPFELGLFFGIWRRQNILIGVGNDLPDNQIAVMTAESARTEAHDVFVLFRKIEAEIGVTDAQLLAACPFTAEGRAMIQKDIAEWAAKQANN